VVITLFVRELTVHVQVGANPQEQGRTQPLILDAEIVVRAPVDDHLEQTVDYGIVGDCATQVAETGHIVLIETFALRLGALLLGHDGVLSVDLRVRKPDALAPAVAGVRIRLGAPV